MLTVPWLMTIGRVKFFRESSRLDCSGVSYVYILCIFTYLHAHLFFFFFLGYA